ncbi:MAG: DUF1622 domain-containing protein [Deinococcus sp.]
MDGSGGLSLGTARLLIEAVGSLYVLGYTLAALLALLHRSPAAHLDAARLLVAEGALAGLNFKAAATLLKTIELHTWQQLGLFVAVFALRTLIKRFFAWELRQLRQAGRVRSEALPGTP